jgi:hypothetical protein
VSVPGGVINANLLGPKNRSGPEGTANQKFEGYRYPAGRLEPTHILFVGNVIQGIMSWLVSEKIR